MKQAILAEEKTLDALVSVLRKNLKSRKVTSACLFGSVARKAEKDDSDIDILVISNDFESASAALARTSDKVSQVFGNGLSPLILSEKELHAKKNDESDTIGSE